MARYTGPKNRLSRREGIDLGNKTAGTKAHAGLLKRLTVPPGQHGHKGRRKISGFGIQLREKQKVKRLYGLLEKQYRNIFDRARKWKGNTGEKMLEFLERRLDNVVYRLNFSPTRALARQLTTHGHVYVDGRRLTIPSALVAAGQVITLSPKAMEIPAVKKIMEDKSAKMSAWLERQGPAGKIARLPGRADISEDINEQLIVEFYSR